VQIECVCAETQLHQRHRARAAGGAGEAGLVDEVARDGPVHHAEYLSGCGTFVASRNRSACGVAMQALLYKS